MEQTCGGWSPLGTAEACGHEDTGDGGAEQAEAFLYGLLWSQESGMCYLETPVPDL